MTKNIVIVTALILIIGGGYFFLSRPADVAPTSDTSPSPTSQPIVSPEPNTIILTPNGYTPQSLTIKAGSEITWVNQSGEIGNVSSDPHPVHSTYQPLNLGDFADGSSLSISFPAPGTYTYHDHLTPSRKGSITVE